MAKKKEITLKGIDQAISKVVTELHKAQKATKSAGKKKLALKIKKLKRVKKELKAICRGTFSR